MKQLYVIFMLAAIAGCGGGKDRAAQDAAPAQRAQRVVISESEAGERTWYLSADAIEFINNDDSFALLENPFIVSQKDGRRQSSVTARQGRYDFNLNLIAFSGDVVGISQEENVRIETQKAFYDTQTKRIWINEKVTIIREGVTVTAQGLKADSGLSEIQIFKQKTTLPQNIEDFNLSLNL